MHHLYRWASPGGSAVKNPPARAGDTGSIPGLGRSPGGGHGKPTLAWGIPMDRGALQAIVNGVAEESDIT